MDKEINNVVNNKIIDFDKVTDSARIAVYDDLLSSPKIIDIDPCETKTFINNLACTIDREAKQIGGSIPYTVVLQVTQNFIHAYFSEMVISILDHGNTIRFSDQGPGIQDKKKAQLPGYSSATKEMKQYIDGVGSGLPIVKEYMETKHGVVLIEDNINQGSVITISLNSHTINNNITQPESFINSSANINKKSLLKDMDSSGFYISSLSEKSKKLLLFFEFQDIWGVKALSEVSGIAQSSTHNLLKKMTELGLIRKIGTKNTLTDFGKQVLKDLKDN